MKKVLTCLIISLSLFSVACAAKSKNMILTEKKNRPNLASQKSRIVFIREKSTPFRKVPAIIDENGNYIGESNPESIFVSDFDPGSYTFIVWGEGTHAMKANLKAGKTYYVHVTPHMGIWGARFKLDSIKKNSKEWKEKDEWMNQIPLFISDTVKGQKTIDKRGQEVIKSVVEKGKMRFDNYSEKEKIEKTLFPEDGE